MRRFRLKYTGGLFGIILITFMSLTVLFIPVAVIALINDIELIEVA